MNYLILVTFIVVTSLFTNCKNEKEQEKVVIPTIEKIEITRVEIEEEDFEFQFAKAIASSKINNNKQETLKIILKAIDVYKEETANTKGSAKKTSDAGLKALEEFKVRYSKDEIKNVEGEMEKAFLKADEGIAHKLIVEVDDIVIIPVRISQSESYYSKTLTYFKKVIQKEKGEAKLIGEKIITKAERIQKKLKGKQNVTAEQINEFYASSKAWADKHWN
ncbi:MAG TPA: hypothetical protein PLX69_06735 [Leptospiraceae bacterium]|nr:hypothetical protein [Leptospiraceae bacterium]HRG74234.1 hypothetical protein [Leptospiraceae bacterium]